MTLARAKAKGHGTFIEEASFTIVRCHDMFVVQATGVNAIFFPSLLLLWVNKLERFSLNFFTI
jgi:hypothetical protein